MATDLFNPKCIQGKSSEYCKSVLPYIQILINQTFVEPKTYDVFNLMYRAVVYPLMNWTQACVSNPDRPLMDVIRDDPYFYSGNSEEYL
jgi:hypothetical protein